MSWSREPLRWEWVARCGGGGCECQGGDLPSGRASVRSARLRLPLLLQARHTAARLPPASWCREATCLTDAGLLETEPLQGTDEDAVASADFPSVLSEEEREALKAELVQLEEEITTLRQVLSAKERHLVEIRQKLGMSLMNELKQNFSRSWHDVQTTAAYKKTQETLSHAGQKATAAFSTMGTAISRKLGDMRSHSIGHSIRHSISMPAMRNSPTFKSFEERVETTVTSFKTKVGGTNHSRGNFEEVLSSTAQASAQSTPGGPQQAEDERLQC
ncbi:Tumor protein D53 [Fukomys damarensis]|uniref:Tumor protein D53 n=1 Tax=Fukomys damarensis TaxID=885580 RepID=A0A091DQQ6_FUKDA|nr:Tumor protein D53 [Fukomys damarensis]